MEVLLSPTAAPAQLQDAIATAVKHRLPLVIPRLTRAELGRVVIRIARVADPAAPSRRARSERQGDRVLDC